MAKTHHLTKKQLTTIFFSYGLHLWIMVFVLNIAVYYVARYYSFGKTCLTPVQVQSDNRCLYIMGGKVYEKGTRNAPHNGHPCGTDITSVIPPSHVGNPSMYLLPNNVGDICTVSQAPPAAPQPKPKPTNTPMPAPTLVPQPTSIPAAVAQPTSPFASAPKGLPTAIPKANATPTIAATTPIPTTASKPQPTGNIYTALPVPNISAALTGPGIAFSFAMPNIGKDAVPLHKTKAVTLNIYEEKLNAQDLQVTPNYTVTAEATFDTDTASPTYGLFVVPRADLGNTVPAGNYHIAFKTNQIPLTLLKVSDAETQGTVFHLTTGNLAPEKPSVKNVLVGDLNGDNIFNIQDYSTFVDCYGAKSTQATCLAPDAADLNENGSVEGIDYILMLQSIKTALTLGRAEIPTPTPTLIAALPIIATNSGVTTTPTVASASVGLAKPKQKPSPTIKYIASKTKTVSPTSKPSETLVNGSSAITFSQIVTYFALFLVVLVALFGAYKSRLFNKLLPAKKAPTETAPPPEQPVAPVPQEKKQISQVFYVNNATKDPNTGMFSVTLTDDSGSGVGYMSQQPPADGYYTVTGNTEEVNGVVSVTILTLTPALKPGTNF